MNRLLLMATLAERGPLRYTPAGLPVLDLVLAHESELEHEGHRRKVSLQIKALAVGSATSPVQQLPLGVPAQFGGFLATSRNGRGLLFHITDLTH